MRDKREPTPVSALEEAEARAAARRLPRVLGARLRAARVEAGLSQEAVAKEMSLGGFSWRQTTVAKSEAADRPVLFSEVAALARLYRRPIHYFMNPGTDLDNVVYQALDDLNAASNALEILQAQVADLQDDFVTAQCIYCLASAVSRYRELGDGGHLLSELRDFLDRWGRQVLEAHSVYDALRVDKKDLFEIDWAALKEVAQVELNQYQGLDQHELELESGELLVGLMDFLEGKSVSETLMGVLREGQAWASLVAVPLTDLLMGAVHRQESEL
ncbi:helix-turn-helix domain-containing protein [Streptomyces scabiei]|uniref:helix-turn-helix domain-containing protein n=1 Tax=Streptomyces scabiei TaxID=1930 RepID=UPI00131A9589|nr:helix-turn-helix transcriptional regulator [Streptomyces scabiei]